MVYYVEKVMQNPSGILTFISFIGLIGFDKEDMINQRWYPHFVCCLCIQACGLLT